jgi:methionine-gamma-lyase
MELATRLEAHPRVTAVAYPGLPSHRDHAIARSMLNGYGGVLSFEVEGGRPAGEAVMDGCRLCVRATSLGSIETLISHPASTTHRQLSGAELGRAGITEGMLRLCVGCEDVADLWADLEQALS